MGRYLKPQDKIAFILMKTILIHFETIGQSVLFNIQKNCFIPAYSKIYYTFLYYNKK